MTGIAWTPNTTGLPIAARHEHIRANVWKIRYHRMRRYARKLELDNGRKTRLLQQSPSVSEAINLACATYGHCSELWRKARCESKLSPSAHNSSGASGLFQFLESTWRSTPYGRMSVWSAYANAMAAGWMHARGRGGEWVCR